MSIISLLKLGRKEVASIQVGSEPGQFKPELTAPDPIVELIQIRGARATVQTATREEVLQALEGQTSHEGTLWIDVRGLGRGDLVGQIAEGFGLHELSVEDVMNLEQHAKVEAYPDYLFVITRFYRGRTSEGEDLDSEQISFCLKDRCLLTFQENQLDTFAHVKRSLETGAAVKKCRRADALFHRLFDHVLDRIFPLLEKLSARAVELEKEVLEEPRKDLLGEIFQFKQTVHQIRRRAWPMREVTKSLLRDNVPQLRKKILPYFRDCQDNAAMALDLIESYRDHGNNLMNVYMSSLSHRTNEVMHILTVISTIFIPLTFITGLYGMNFNPAASPYNMPELNSRYGYPVVWAVMIATTLALLAVFHSWGWLQRMNIELGRIEDDPRTLGPSPDAPPAPPVSGAPDR